MQLFRKADSNEFYECVLLHAEDALIISEKAKNVLRDEIGKYF